MEEEDPYKIVVPLKNGAGRMSIGAARHAQELLRLTLNQNPELITTLHALIEGRGGEVSPEQRRALKDDLLLTRAERVPPDIRAVMVAGYRETPAGPVITEPLDLTNPEHAAAAQQADDERDAAFRRMDPRIRMLMAGMKSPPKRKDDDQERSR